MAEKTIVIGVGADSQTRCRHYRGPLDIIAIKFPCCGIYYCCYECHREAADHPAVAWKRSQFDEKAVLCGVCKKQWSIREYLNCGNVCPACGSGFNPGCAKHYPLYFQISDPDQEGCK